MRIPALPSPSAARAVAVADARLALAVAMGPDRHTSPEALHELWSDYTLACVDAGVIPPPPLADWPAPPQTTPPPRRGNPKNGGTPRAHA